MDFEHIPPKWENAGTEPPDSLKKEGFRAGYKPPAEYFNWFFNRIYKCVTELQSKFASTGVEVGGLTETVNELKKSVSDGKSLVAAAITRKKIPTAADATFAQMADNIDSIKGGSGNAQPSDVLAGKTFANDNGEQVGTIPSRGAASIVPGTTAQEIAAGQYLAGKQTIASLGGNATAAQVLSGYSFSSDAAGRARSGGMTNRGALFRMLGINETFNLPAGYYSGGSVKQSVATQGALTYTPTTSAQVAAVNGKYMTGNVFINPIPSNYYNANGNALVFDSGAYYALGNAGAYYVKISSTLPPIAVYNAVTITNGALYLHKNTNSSSETQVYLCFRRYIPNGIYKSIAVTGYGSLASTQCSIVLQDVNGNGSATTHTWGTGSTTVTKAFPTHTINPFVLQLRLSSYPAELYVTKIELIK